MIRNLSQSATFALRSVPDLFLADPARFMTLLSEHGDRFIEQLWADAGGSAESNASPASMAPPAHRVLRSGAGAAVVLFKLPQPSRAAEPHYLGLVAQPGSPQVVSLEYEASPGGGAPKTVLRETTSGESGPQRVSEALPIGEDFFVQYLSRRAAGPPSVSEPSEPPAPREKSEPEKPIRRRLDTTPFEVDGFDDDELEEDLPSEKRGRGSTKQRTESNSGDAVSGRPPILTRGFVITMVILFVANALLSGIAGGLGGIAGILVGGLQILFSVPLLFTGGIAGLVALRADDRRRAYLRWPTGLMAMGVTAFVMGMMPSQPSSEAYDPFPIAEATMPSFPRLPRARVLPDGVRKHSVELREGQLPGGRMTIWIYLPKDASGPLPTVLIGAAGSNLLHGMPLTEGDTPEHLPYARAGFAVIAYSIDGITESDDFRELRDAFHNFRSAQAGLINARIALDYALERVPEVDEGRIYAVGHSSAGTMALLLAAHEERLHACVAYAPQCDVSQNFGPLPLVAIAYQDGGVIDFATRCSPMTHVDRIRCPVYLFHARDDEVITAPPIEAFKSALEGNGTEVEYQSVARGGHYDSMIAAIPGAIEWMEQHGAK